MADAEDVDLLQDDISDLALQAEPVVDAETVASDPQPQTEDNTHEKKTSRSQGSAPSSSKAKRVPIPVPPHAKAAEEAPAPKPAPVKPASKPAPTRRPESVAVARGPSKGGRYFVMKSVSAPNVEYSIAYGVWATQVCIVTHPLLSGRKNSKRLCHFVVCELFQEPSDFNSSMTYMACFFVDHCLCLGQWAGLHAVRSWVCSQPLLGVAVCGFHHDLVAEPLNFTSVAKQEAPREHTLADRTFHVYLTVLDIPTYEQIFLYISF